jgi:hypothetical protein
VLTDIPDTRQQQQDRQGLQQQQQQQQGFIHLHLLMRAIEKMYFDKYSNKIKAK